jgi:hypothetical protein
MTTVGEAFDKGYLQKKKVFLKPVPRGGKLVKSPEHVAYFQIEGAKNWFQLPKAERGGYANPFPLGDEEKQFFEKELDIDLSIHKKKDNFWHTFFVKVIKDYNLMHEGYKFDLSDPMDNLRYRVTKMQAFVAPSWEDRFNKGEYKFALVDEGYEEAQELDAGAKMAEAYTKYGEIRNSIPKLKNILGVYFLEKNEMKFVPEDASLEFLQKEVNKVVKDETDLFIKIVNDPASKIKTLINSSIRAGSIIKEARNKYMVVGENVSYSYKELVNYLAGAEKTKEDIYLKLVAQAKDIK